ncbi:MAG: 4-hydroxy-tetrahydrodipicolinate synthase [Verrucomicrobia bacterium]|nr:4-hydroxy-tetrahydrodipicolinate synthase [Verrucomicrobiota bacterium]
MFAGTYTAIVTPFLEDGAVDFARFEALINWQAEAGVDGIVPVGTTGESPTLDYDEHQEVVRTAVRVSRGRLKIIAGTGGNSTAEALTLTASAREAGADATLQVTPYYNKPNDEGLYRHFSAVADLGLPVVLYNVPGRTSREIPLDVVARLAEHPQVVAIKEAAGSVDRVSAILNRCPGFTVLSGDDSLALPMMAVGAKGVISVASNVAPELVSQMVRAIQAERWTDARALHTRLYPLFRDIFIDTNPIPVKAALAMQGRILEQYRLPMCTMPDALKARLRQTLKDVL